MEDENNLICSPTESECSNGPLYNDQEAQGPRIGGEFGGNNGNSEDFMPKAKLGPLNQVVASLRGQDAKTGRSYGPLGSCPNLTQTSGPLLNRTCIIEDSEFETVVTPQGSVDVYKGGVQGRNAPFLITFHDLGLNHSANYSSFLGCSAMAAVVSRFSILHVTAPGQRSNCPNLPIDFQYPSMEQLSEMVEYVCHHYGVASFVGLGTGLGANVLVRLAFRRPKLVEGLILFNCNITSAGWVEWAYHKMNIKSLKKSSKFPESVVEYLLWHHIGSRLSPDTLSLASIYKQHFMTQVNPGNLGLLIQAYATRNDIKLARDLSADGKTLYGANRTLKMPVLNIVGDNSPHIEATVNFNGRLDPARCTWMKMQEAGMVLEEQPIKVAEAIRLFLQGLGYTLSTRSRSVTSSPLKLSAVGERRAEPNLESLNLNENLKI